MTTHFVKSPSFLGITVEFLTKDKIMKPTPVIGDHNRVQCFMETVQGELFTLAVILDSQYNTRFLSMMDGVQVCANLGGNKVSSHCCSKK